MSLKQIFNRWRFGKTLDHCGATGETMLTMAVKACDVKSASEFIALGASVDKPNAAGEYPLFLALEQKDKKMFRLLIEADAMIGIQQGGKTLYDFAVAQGMQDEANVITGVIKQEIEFKHTAVVMPMMGGPLMPPHRSALYEEAKKPKR